MLCNGVWPCMTVNVCLATPCRPVMSVASEGLIQGINEVEEMLSTNIVQGKLNQTGNYGEW